MKKKLLKPISECSLNKVNTLIYLHKNNNILEISLTDFQKETVSFKYLCSIVKEDIDKDYCWHLEDFLEAFESISGRENFVIYNNKIVYDNGKELSLPTPAEEKKFEFIELNDTEKSLEITGKELDCFKNFEKMRSELKEFPDIGSKVFFSVTNHQLYAQSMTGYSAFEMFFDKNQLEIDNTVDYGVNYDYLKNLNMKKLGISGCTKGRFKVIEQNNEMVIVIKMTKQSGKSEFQEIQYNIHTQKTMVQMGEKFFQRYINGINTHHMNDIELELDENIDLKSLKSLVTEKNKKEGGTGKRYRVIFEIVDGVLLAEENRIRLFDKNYPEVMLINGYDLLTILANGNNLHYSQDEEYYYLMNYCQILVIKKTSSC